MQLLVQVLFTNTITISYKITTWFNSCFFSNTCRLNNKIQFVSFEFTFCLFRANKWKQFIGVELNLVHILKLWFFSGSRIFTPMEKKDKNKIKHFFLYFGDFCFHFVIKKSFIKCAIKFPFLILVKSDVQGFVFLDNFETNVLGAV